MRRPKQNRNTLTKRSPFKKSKQNVTGIENLPTELLSEILARVGAASLPDLFNAKVSCKLFQETSKDKYVYQHVSLEKFPLVSWNPPNEKQQAFLSKCEECNNPEIFYRRALVGYYSENWKLESALKLLKRAADLNHIGAQYTSCILQLFSGDEEQKEKGEKMLASMKRNRVSRKEIKLCRENLRKNLNEIWVLNPAARMNPASCCTTTCDYWKNRAGWDDSNTQEDEDEDDAYCQKCGIDIEMRSLRI